MTVLAPAAMALAMSPEYWMPPSPIYEASQACQAAGVPLIGAAAIAASFLSGVVGIAGTSFTGAMAVAYLIGGLALMHSVARSRGAWVLWLVYGGLLVFGPYMALALTVAGLFEPVLKLARRSGGPPSST